MTAISYRRGLHALLLLLITAPIAVAAPKPSDGYLHYNDRIASDTMYTRRGDPAAVMDFAIMASASGLPPFSVPVVGLHLLTSVVA